MSVKSRGGSPGAGKEPLCFTVHVKDLMDPEKNPGLKLSVKSIWENDRIPKTVIRYRDQGESI